MVKLPMDRYKWRRICLPHIPVALKNDRLDLVRRQIRTSNEEYGQYYTHPEVSRYPFYLPTSHRDEHPHNIFTTSNEAYGQHYYSRSDAYYVKQSDAYTSSLSARDVRPEREDPIHLPAIEHKYLVQAEPKEILSPQRPLVTKEMERYPSMWGN